MAALTCSILALAGAVGAQPSAEFERALKQQTPPGVMVEALWENDVKFHQFLRFDTNTRAFILLSRLECHLRDPQGRCFYSSPPFNTFEEISDPVEIPHVDGLLDSLTCFFLLRSFITPTKSVEPMTLLDGGAFRVNTTYVNDARGIPYEIYERFPANRLTPLEWTIAPDFSRIEKAYPALGKSFTIVPTEKAPKWAWLMENERNILRSVRTLPSDPSAFTHDAARNDFTKLSRMSERRLVFSRTKIGEPNVANPPTQAEIDAQNARNAAPAWRWPLLAAGVLVIAAAWFAKRRSA